MLLKLTISLFTLNILFVTPAVTWADSWALPKERTVCSANNKYCLKVIPKKLTSQLDYFEDKVDEKENAGADNKIKNNKCRGIFYVRNANGKLQKRWEIDLVNEVSPVDILVSNEGEHVITFDNWHSVGYGDDVVAIYSASNGKLIKNFGLSAFLTEQDISSLPRSISSIWWGGKHFLDPENQQLVLQVTKGKMTFDKDVEYFQVRVDLTDGKVIDEKRDRYESLQFTFEPTIDETVVQDSLTEAASACLHKENSKLLTLEELNERISFKKMPIYPPAARAIRATGTVIVAINVNKQGVAECAEALSGHPLLKAVVLDAINSWKFVKADSPYSGYLSIKGTWQLVAPDGTINEKEQK